MQCPGTTEEKRGASRSTTTPPRTRSLSPDSWTRMLFATSLMDERLATTEPSISRDTSSCPPSELYAPLNNLEDWNVLTSSAAEERKSRQLSIAEKTATWSSTESQASKEVGETLTEYGNDLTLALLFSTLSGVILHCTCNIGRAWRLTGRAFLNQDPGRPTTSSCGAVLGLERRDGYILWLEIAECSSMLAPIQFHHGSMGTMDMSWSCSMISEVQRLSDLTSFYGCSTDIRCRSQSREDFENGPRVRFTSRPILLPIIGTLMSQTVAPSGEGWTSVTWSSTPFSTTSPPTSPML